MNNNDVISILQNLVETCTTGQSTFRNSAESIHNSEFRRLFNIFSQQRAQFIAELHSEVTRLGGDLGSADDVAVQKNNTIPFKTPSSNSAMRDEATVISECQREEEAAVNDYHDALNADFPLAVQYLANRPCTAIQVP